jgi:hypothetical protein
MGIKINRLIHFFAWIVVLFFAACSPSKKIVKTDKPVDVIVKDTVSVVVPKDTTPIVVVKEILTIGLILPLQLDKHFEEDSIPDSEPLIIANSIPALNFYEGVLAAIDSTKKFGLDVRIKVIDIGGDSTQTAKVLSKKSLPECDFYLSMIPSTNNNLLKDLGNKLKKPIFIQQGANTQMLDSVPNIWMSIPSNITQLKEFAKYIYDSQSSSNFIVVYRDLKKESDLANYVASIVDSIAGKPSTCIKVNYKNVSWAGLQNKLSKTKKNVLFIPSGDESYLSSLLAKIKGVEDQYSFSLCGLPIWEQFETVDPDILKEEGTYIFGGVFIDYSKPNVKSFRKSFINEFHSDPSTQAYQAFDIVNYIVENFSKHKVDYSKYTSTSTLMFPEKGFNFKEVCVGCGKENVNLSILKFGDYKLIRVNK